MIIALTALFKKNVVQIVQKVPLKPKIDKVSIDYTYLMTYLTLKIL
jgi:hypothetical protein